MFVMGERAVYPSVGGEKTQQGRGYTLLTMAHPGGEDRLIGEHASG